MSDCINILQMLMYCCDLMYSNNRMSTNCPPRILLNEDFVKHVRYWQFTDFSRTFVDFLFNPELRSVIPLWHILQQQRQLSKFLTSESTYSNFQVGYITIMISNRSKITTLAWWQVSNFKHKQAALEIWGLFKK